jgi:superfamily II DNA or RNA helicase
VLLSLGTNGNKINPIWGRTGKPHESQPRSLASAGTKEPTSVRAFTKSQGARAKLLPERHTPKPYQNTAIDKVTEGFKEHDRGQLILPCGTGKTETALWIKEKLKPKKTLCLFPSIALVKQTKERWEEQRDPNKNYDYLCVCSDPGVDSQKRSKGDEENEAEEFKALKGSKVTSKPDEIKSFLEQEGESVVFATYQSLPKIIDAMKNNDIEFDLTIADEAHVTAGEEGRLFTAMHDNDNLRSKKRLYMTATPRVLSENSQADGDSTLIGMNNQDVYGPEFHRMSFAEAIQAGALVDYKLVVLGIKPGESRSIIDRQSLDIRDVDLSSVAKSVALDKFMKKNGLRRALTFHSRKDNAENFAKTRKLVTGNEDSYYVDGTMPVTVRNQILDQFKAAKGSSTVSNARCLTAGVDVPSIDTVVFIDPKSKNAKVDIVQAAGRAMRKDPKNPDKKCGYIVLPVILNEDGAIDKTLPSYEGLKHVIGSLALHDERLETFINQRRNQDESSNPAFVTPAIDGPEIKVLTLDDTLEKINTVKNKFQFTEEVIACSREMLTGSRYRSFEEARQALLKLAPRKPKKLRNISDLPITLLQLNRLALNEKLIDKHLSEAQMLTFIWEPRESEIHEDITNESAIQKFTLWADSLRSSPRPHSSQHFGKQYKTEFNEEEKKFIYRYFDTKYFTSLMTKIIDSIWGTADPEPEPPTDDQLIAQIRGDYPFCPQNYEEIIRNDERIKQLKIYKNFLENPAKLAKIIWGLSPLDAHIEGLVKRLKNETLFFNIRKNLSEITLDSLYKLRSKYPNKLSLADLEKNDLYKQISDEMARAFSKATGFFNGIPFTNSLDNLFGKSLAAKISAFIWGDIAPILNPDAVREECKNNPNLTTDDLNNILENHGNSSYVSESQLGEILHDSSKFSSFKDVFDFTLRNREETRIRTPSDTYPKINLMGLRISKEALQKMFAEYTKDSFIPTQPFLCLVKLAEASLIYDKINDSYLEIMKKRGSIPDDERLEQIFNHGMAARDQGALTFAELKVLAKLLGRTLPSVEGFPAKEDDYNPFDRGH